MSDLVKQLRDYINFVDDIELRRIAANQLEELEAKIIAQQARIEQLKEQLVIAGRNCVDDFIAAGCLQSVDFPDDLSALRAHDAEIWREAAQVCEQVAWLNKNASMLGPELNAIKCKDAMLARADAIEKGGV